MFSIPPNLLALGLIWAAAPAAPAPAAPAPANASGDLFFTMLMIGMMVLWFWLIVLRPNRRAEQDRQAQLAALKVGDEVVTSGGLIATVAKIHQPAEGQTNEISEVVLRIDPGKIRVLRNSILRIVSASASPGGGEAKK